MQTFSFISLYINETSTVRTILVRGDVSKGSQPVLRHLARWLRKDNNRKIVELIIAKHPNILLAQHWFSAAIG